MKLKILAAIAAAAVLCSHVAHADTPSQPDSSVVALSQTLMEAVNAEVYWRAQAIEAQEKIKSLEATPAQTNAAPDKASAGH